MSGFVLPSFRWLLAGAVAAGLWVVWHESDKPRPQVPVGEAEEEILPEMPKPAKAASPAQVAPLPDETTALLLPDIVAAPQWRPDTLATGSVPRPKRAAENSLRTTAKVNLRQRASVESPVVTQLDEGQPVKSLAASGEWRLVSVDGLKGWIHVQYLGRIGEEPVREAAVEPEKREVRREPPARHREAARNAEPGREFVPQRKSLDGYRIEPRAEVGRSARLERAGRRSPFSQRPVRAPQGGDCQCPYDLMLNGAECGDHSAYVIKGPEYAQCYF